MSTSNQLNMQRSKERIAAKLKFKAKLKQDIDLASLPTEILLRLHVLATDKPRTIQECHNQMAWMKKSIKPLLKDLHERKTEIHKLKTEIREYSKTQEPLEEDLEILQLEINGYELTLSYLAWLYNKLEYICNFYEEHNLPLEDFIQVIGVNGNDVKIWFDKCFHGVHDKLSKYMSYLHDGIESEHTKWNEGFHWNRYGMPFFELITAYMIDYVMAKYKELVGEKQYNDEFMGIFDNQLPMYTMNEDEDGNQTLEQYYPTPKLIKEK